MNKVCRYLLIIAMIIFVFVQIFCINWLEKDKNIKAYNTNNTISYLKTLQDFNEELNCSKEKNILSANKINGKWYLKVKITGNKEELLEELLKFKNYNIDGYIINKNKDENYIVLDISV
jgi:hypothetical protein